MTFTPRNATVYSNVSALRPVVRAFRKLGKPVALLPIEGTVDAADAYRLRQAQRLPGAITVFTLIDAAPPTNLAALGVDCVLQVTSPELFPHGDRTSICAGEPLTTLLKLINIVQPTDLYLSEKDHHLLVAAQHMVTDLFLELRVHAVPILREADGLALDARNQDLSPAGREAALAISAALAAGAHAAEGGKDAVLAAANAVLAAAPQVKLKSMELQGPEVGDARLLITAEVEGIPLSDNVGVPLGIGFQDLAGDTGGGDGGGE